MTVATPIAMEWVAAYVVLGAFVGFFAGMLGIGGGAIMVPLLVLLMDAQGLPHDQVLHLAVGTSMSTILFTSLSSMRSHQRRGAIRWDLFRSMTPGIVIGGLLGSALASHIPATALAIAFTAIISVAATNMLLNRQPRASRQLPGWMGQAGVGAAIGGASSIAAMGGGFASVPYMVWCNVPMIQAIGTAAALGFPIALAGTIGFVYNGLNDSGLPPWSLGYVYLPAMLGITVTSVLFAPVGAAAAHRLPTALLKRIFAVLLYVLAARMLVKMI
jgi:uncharacterized membrane protein YfcA